MRKNLPVTQKEYVLPEGSVIISYTDLKGLITHANEDFVEASGFERDELMGKPHNLVRHPDVPPEAFRDLWDTIESGRPWEGIVKNRRKNGDHYWVKATATPLPNGSGYMSVRTAPTRAEIASAEKLYSAMWQNSNIRLSGGLLFRPGIIGFIQRWYARLRLFYKIFIPVSAIGVLAILATLTLLAPALHNQEMLTILSLSLGINLVLILSMLALVLYQQSKRLAKLNKAAAAICDDDYSQPLPYEGEDDISQLACATAFMRNRMAEMVFSLRQGLEKLNQSAEKLSSSSHHTATGAENQSSAAITISAAVEELSASIRTIEKDAGDTRNIAVETGHASTRAAKTVHDAALEIAHIAQAVNHAAAELSELEDISLEIGKIVSSIHEIAEQTNLLALNAAIEAARAGERGRGFAVVADEVRNLASRTTKATAEIGNMVSRIQSRTKQTVGEMKHSVSLVDEGVRSAHGAGDQVAALEDKTQNVEEAISQIYELLQQQALATEEIAGNIDGIAHTAEANLDAARQVANAATEVEYMAKTLTRLSWRD